MHTTFSALALAALLVTACGSEGGDSPEPSETGGTASAEDGGPAPASGGASEAGGTGGTGGTSSGGSPSSGGSLGGATGGAVSTDDGGTGTGGAAESTGGSSNVGGIPGTGGISPSTGGAMTATGGTTSTGGTTGTGGTNLGPFTDPDCPTWTGYHVPFNECLVIRGRFYGLPETFCGREPANPIVDTCATVTGARREGATIYVKAEPGRAFAVTRPVTTNCAALCQ